jgi:polar amino acid transport system substrate-binding protein
MNIRSWFTKTAALAVTLLLAVSTVHAAGPDSPVLSRIAKTSTLRVGMTGTQPPFNVTNRDGKIIGMDHDLAQLLASSMGVELEVVPMSFVDLLPALEEGDVDIVVSGMTATLERNMRVPFVGPYFISGISILTKEAMLEKLNTPEELNAGGRNIAALKGSTSEKFAEAILNNPKMTAVDSHADGVKLLLDGDVDAVVIDAIAGKLAILRNPDSGLAISEPVTTEPIAIALAPGDALFLNLVENYLRALSATGMLSSLQEKWLGDGSWLAQVP